MNTPDYTAKIYKDSFNGIRRQWQADLYEDGTLLGKGWWSGHSSRKSLVAAIKAGTPHDITVAIDNS